jgi:hypothetical protein
VTIEGGGGSGAAAKAILAKKIKVEVKNAGTGYTSEPTVTIEGGGGSGAAAKAILANKIKVEVRNAGTGYTSEPTVTIEGGGGSGAEAKATIESQAVKTIEITKQGSGYTSEPKVKVEGGGGNGAQAAASLDGVVSKIEITKEGSGYKSEPKVKVEGGGGNGAQATASLDGVVSKIEITKEGSGYTSEPKVKVEGGGGNGAQATASLDGVVSKIEITKEGTGYTSKPKVKIEGGGGSGAEAEALLDKPKGSDLTAVSTDTEQSNQSVPGGITGRSGPPTEAAVREIGLMHKRYMDKDDIGTLLDACITASDLLEEPTKDKIEVASKAAKRYSDATDKVLSETQKGRSEMTFAQLEGLTEEKNRAEEEFLKRVAEMRLSPLGQYCVIKALPTIVQNYEYREINQNQKIELCKYAVQQAQKDPSWKDTAHQCMSVVFR